MQIEPTKSSFLSGLNPADKPPLKAQEQPASPALKGEEVQLSQAALRISNRPSSGRKSGSGSKTPKAAIVESGPAPQLPMSKTKWTVLVYGAADNDLEQYVAQNLSQMERVGSSKEMNIVAQIDRGPKADKSLGGHINANRYYIMKDNDTKHINSPRLQRLGPTDSADPKELQSFLAWGMKNFPADHYLVVLNDHGAGFLGALEDATEKSFMSLPSIAKAITGAEQETGVDKDKVTIGFDACLMGQAEVAYELKDAGTVLAASEEVIGGKGWPYPGILSAGKKAESGEEMANIIVAQSAKHPDSTFTMSAVDLKSSAALKDSIDNFAKAILASDTPVPVIKKTIADSQHYTVGVEETPYSDMHDIYDIAHRIANNDKIEDKKLKAAAKEVMHTVKAMVISEEHEGEGREDSHGLSIYAPVKHIKSNIADRYGKTALAQDTSWDEVIAKFSGKPEPASKKDHGKPAFFNKEHLK